MAFSPNFFVIVTLVVLLQLLFVSASTKPIDAICGEVTDKAFCVKTLSAFPAAVSASTTFQAALAALRLAQSYTEKPIQFTGKAVEENPKMKEDFLTCQHSYKNIKNELQGAPENLKDHPEDALYSCKICYDETKIVKDIVGKNGDVASKTLIQMTLMMDKIIDIAVGATLAVGG